MTELQSLRIAVEMYPPEHITFGVTARGLKPYVDIEIDVDDDDDTEMVVKVTCGGGGFDEASDLADLFTMLAEQLGSEEIVKQLAEKPAVEDVEPLTGQYL